MSEYVHVDHRRKCVRTKVADMGGTDQDWYWLREIARLLEQLLREQRSPSVLDWMSGLVLPLVLGLATVGVAIWAITVAKASNGLAERLHKQSTEETARRLRIPYASELSSFVFDIIEARRKGQDGTAVVLDIPRLTDLGRIQDASDEESAGRLAAWALMLARLSPSTSGNFAPLSARIRSGITVWREDPARAIAIFEADKAELDSYVKTTNRTALTKRATSRQAKAAPTIPPTAP